MISEDKMHPDSELQPSSSCSAASPGGDSPGCTQHPPDSLSSSEDQDSDLSAGAAFVPTVTAVSTSPELERMVQPTAIASAAAKNKAQGAKQTSAGSKKAKPYSRKGQREQPSKEEEERRRIRRERNKIAAAKCRNRRRELIDTLQAETDSLEEEKSALEGEIASLLKEKERLEEVLASHSPTCRLPGDADMEEDNSMQDPPASPHLLSILDKPPESSTDVPTAPDDASCIPAAAILGNSNILLCSSAEEDDLEDLTGEDLDNLVPSLEMAVTSENAVSVPDIDLSGPFSLPDWETLYKSVANDLESFSTSAMSSSPSCSSYRTVFSFNYSEIESLADGCDSLKGGLASSEFIKDSLNSPTLLAL
ncbi:hypothetical protein OJAV_G00232600 [Oryzias javanicus]|uniref:Protein c-Fos n=1 Tax=Oryzias javanicus TaxID=123683 RepID=A0A3S2NPC5_ORYJA|nr:hypothetical protein OJAV_G00232600 [Oryzias javanicus]